MRASPPPGEESVGAAADLPATELIDALPQIVWVSDAQGHDRLVSRRWRDFTGVDDPDVGRRSALIHAEDRARTIESWQRSVASGEPFEAEFRLRRHDGAWCWHLARASAQRDHAGRVLRWIGTATDVEAQRRAARELQALQARQAFLLALGDRLRSLTDPHAAMQAAAEMLGRHLRVGRCGYAELDEDGEHLLIEPGWNDGTMSNPAGRYRLRDIGVGLFDELRAGRTLRIADTRDDPRVGPRAALDRELRASIAAPLIKFGRLVALLYVHESLPRQWSDDEAQLVREVAERTWSSSERARAVRALQQSEERLRLATEGVGLGTWESDLASGVMRWSESHFRIFGLTRTADGRVPPGTFIERVHPQDRARVAAAFERACGGEPYRPEYRLLRGDDATERWVAAFGRVFPGPAGVGGRFVGITVDVTERKRLEAERESLLESERAARGAAEAATRAKDDFLATLSHELRTPLSVIVSWSRVLQRRFEQVDPELKRGLKTIADNAFAQSQLMSDLLDMSRIVAGKLTLELRPVDLRELVTDAVDARLPEADTRKIALTQRLPADLEPALVLAEPGRLHQVLGNLLGNALKFTPAGGAIEVVLARGAGTYEIEVRDDGEGIAAPFLPHVFERFRQADGGAARRHGGLGLGLSVVRQLVELHGGGVAVHSEGQGRGATFRIWLPAIESTPIVARGPGSRDGDGDRDGGEAGAAHDGAVWPAAGAAALAGLRVLAVEDEPSMRDYLVRVLEEQGARVGSAASAAEALSLLQAAAGETGPCGYDLLVSDIGLPGLDGHELLRAVRALPGHGPERLGALALTAFARDEDRRRCLAAGFQAHLGKPYEVGQLVALLRRLAPRASRGP